MNDLELFASGHRACAGCGAAITMRHVLKAAGKNTIVVNATGCMEVVSSQYPETAWRVPWIHVAFENAAAVASGIDKALEKLNKKVNLLVIGGDGGTFDIGFQALSGAIERNHNFCYVCYDNAGYMNTGHQRSGATPKYASTTTSPAGKKIHGKMHYKKPMPMIIAAHRIYTATANIAFPEDLVKKVQKGLSIKGPAYIQVFSPCPIGWHSPTNLTIDIARLAFEAKISPLYEIEKGFLKFSKKPAVVRTVSEYIKLQGRFKHVTKEEMLDIQQQINHEWEVLNRLEKDKIRLY